MPIAAAVAPALAAAKVALVTPLIVKIVSGAILVKPNKPYFEKVVTISLVLAASFCALDAVL